MIIPSLNLRLTFTSCHLHPQPRETVTHLVRCVVAVVNSLHRLISEFWWASDNSIHSRWRADNLVCSEQSLVSNSKSLRMFKSKPNKISAKLPGPQNPVSRQNINSLDEIFRPANRTSSPEHRLTAWVDIAYINPPPAPPHTRDHISQASLFLSLLSFFTGKYLCLLLEMEGCSFSFFFESGPDRCSCCCCHPPGFITLVCLRAVGFIRSVFPSPLPPLSPPI